jgi:hypothetical protein
MTADVTRSPAIGRDPRYGWKMMGGKPDELLVRMP